MRKSAELTVGGISKNEKKLFDSLGVGHLCGKVDTIKLYYMAMEKVFVADMSGEDVDALRRAIHAINICSPHRGTDEFENLINFNVVAKVNKLTKLPPLSTCSLDERIKRALIIIEAIGLVSEWFYIKDDEHKQYLLKNPERLLDVAVSLNKSVQLIYDIAHGINPHQCCRNNKWIDIVEELESDYKQNGVMDPKEILESWTK